MPRSSRNLVKLEGYIKEYKVFRLSDCDKNNVLYCTVCEKDVKLTDKSKIIRHLEKKLHKNSSVFGQKQTKFETDLCNTLISSNTIFNKLKNAKVKEFIE